MSKFKLVKPKTKKIMYQATHIPRDLYMKIKKASKKYNTSIRDLLVQMINHCLKDMGIK